MQRLFLRFPDYKYKALTLSYDDAVRQDKRLIAIMKKNGIKGTFNMNSGLFTERFDGEEKGRMTLDEAVRLYADSGMEIAAHGVNHLALGMVDCAIGTSDVINDRIALEKIFGRIVKGMAYANGSYDDNVVETLKRCGIRYARTVLSTEKFDLPNDWLRLPATCHHNHPRLMKLAEQFLNQTEPDHYWRSVPMLFYLWGHSYEFDMNDNWNVIEKFCEVMGNRDDIWYATNGELYDYVTAYDRLEFSGNSEWVHNPSALDVYLCAGGKKTLARAGETVLFNK